MARNVAKPRIVRKYSPPSLTSRNKKEIRQCLQADFEGRCAYCMRHGDEISAGHFDIEHFHPRQAGGTNHYENLYWSCKECNTHKWEHWPTDGARAKGRRYADPCREQDYGQHLVEQDNGKLTAITECGRYHRCKLVLNRPDLVKRRRERTELRALVDACYQEIQNLRRAGKSAVSLAQLAKLVAANERVLAIAIPYIPSQRCTV